VRSKKSARRLEITSVLLDLSSLLSLVDSFSSSAGTGQQGYERPPESWVADSVAKGIHC